MTSIDSAGREPVTSVPEVADIPEGTSADPAAAADASSDAYGAFAARPRSTGFHSAQLERQLADVAGVDSPEAALRAIIEAAGRVRGAGPADSAALLRRIAEACVAALNAGGAETPPAPADVEEPVTVGSYGDLFAGARYVKDPSHPKLVEVARAVVARAPELEGSDLARACSEGRLDREDVEALQRFLVDRGYPVGGTGVDGLYGPKTHAALASFLAGGSADAPPPAPSTSTRPTSPVVAGERSLRGDGIPPELRSAFRKAKQSRWNRGGKCLQLAGTIASMAGAKRTIYPHKAYAPPDTSFRGRQIHELTEAVERGVLKPGMLIHVKIHSDREPAYHVADDAHHWFVYMGKDGDGIPRFADRRGDDQTAARMHGRMKGWRNSKRYGDPQYGYVPTIAGIYDPFKDKRA